jgi:hypothetical protein
MLDTLNNKSALVLYTLNKSRIELGVIHNTLSLKTSEAIPTTELMDYLQTFFDGIYKNNVSLIAAMRVLSEGAAESKLDVFDYQSILENISHSVMSIGNPTSVYENPIGRVARSLTLMSLIFSDLTKMNESFRKWCKENRINPDEPFAWAENDQIDLTLDFSALL